MNLEGIVQIIASGSVAYVPLGGGLPAAASALAPILAVLLTLFTGGLIFFRQLVQRIFHLVTHDWRWATFTLMVLMLLGGGAVFWWQ